MSVVVVGGGFAGLAAACRLAAAGAAPVVLERAPRLGGRASSVRFPATGETIDLGHHVLMGCCTASDGFLRRIGRGSAVWFQDELEIPIRWRGGRTALRSSILLPGPLHLAPSLLRYRALSPGERLRALIVGGRLLAGGRRAQGTFGGWLRARGQSTRAIARLWDPISIGALNASADSVAVSAARQVFAEGFFRPGGANIGLFTEPLSGIFEAGRDYVVSRGGTVETAAAAAVRVERSAVRAVETTDGRTIDASAVVAAVPPWDLARMLTGIPETNEWVARARRLRWAPIVDVHLWFDRAVADEPFFIAVDSPLQAVFDLSLVHRASDMSGNRRSHLVLSISAADAWIDRPADAIVCDLMEALPAFLPSVERARLEHRLVMRHRRATFVRAPGADRLRPPSSIGVGGLHLAGDWTATGWPSTIEGAVRSGIAAAAAVETRADWEAPSDAAERDEPNPDPAGARR